ncbi:MAG: M1 family peptidase [Nitrosomonadales bacterium]|nr:M1 family peptidase [Nitrosomonadales bacterium]
MESQNLRLAAIMLAGCLFACAAAGSRAQTVPQHRLSVALHPEQHRLSVRDLVTLPPDGPRTFYFSLHRDMNPVSPDAEIKAADINTAGEAPESWLQQYRVTLPQGRNSFTLTYGGEIFHPPQQDKRETRTFESSPGIIAPQGAVLTGDSGWYPRLDGEMTTFSLEIDLPQGWHAISQGKRTSPGIAGTVWQESQPQNGIFLIAAPFTEYAHNDAGIESLVYLRNGDAVLAQRYLDATARYLAMYQQLIGPYPYAKFALVENFWETGYGMPSFTLLGSQVIHLPFIVDTSYPHEILHNWWGNGVYVDYAGGNWSEGLTAYLADHLLQEQKGNGAEYRRSMLQKYTDFVSAGRDFPLTAFRSRHSEQSEAVGYGKSMMLFHMLRRQLGDGTFTLALQNLYRDYRFKTAGYSNLEQVFARTSGIDLKPYFAQWAQQSGAPQLRPVSAAARRNTTGYELTVVVEQTQPGPAYMLDLPVAVTLAGQDAAYSTVIAVKDKHSELHVQLAAQPLRVDIDPEFDLFRRLDRAEIPPAFSQIFGAEKLLIVLPRKAPEALRAQYLAIAQAWQQQPSRVTTIKWDDEIERLPDDGAVWLFGWENGLRGEFRAALETNGAAMSDSGARFGDGEYARSLHALALALTAHMNQIPAAWLAAPDAAMLPVLARKLPHYAKYSYAAFNGAELTNLTKGTWPVTRSPLGLAVKQEDGGTVAVPRGKLAPRASLADRVRDR